MATQASLAFDLAVTRLCDYLSTLPITTAFQIFALLPAGNELGNFAAGILAGLPAGFFNQTPSHLSAQRFVYEDGKITIQAQANSGPQMPWPTPVAAVASSIVEAQLPTPAQRSMNSFMVFRSFMADLLPHIPQRSKSVTIAELWQYETVKGHWELMARTYTYLRNNYGLRNTSLAAFTRKAAHAMGLGGAEDYAKVLGFELVECRLVMCAPGGQRVHYHLHRSPRGASGFQIRSCSMEDLLKLYVDDPENAPKVNNDAVENVMNIARDMRIPSSDPTANPDEVDDSDYEWSLADIYGVDDHSFDRDPNFTGDPLTDPIYLELVGNEASLLQQAGFTANATFNPSAVALQASAE